MSNIRKRKKGVAGLLITADMVANVAKLISSFTNPRSLPEVMVEIMNGDVLVPESRIRLVRIIEILRIRELSLLSLATEKRQEWVKDQLISTLLDHNYELNETLLRYTVVPQLDSVGSSPCVFYLASDLSKRSRSEEAEVTAAMCALQLAESAQINSVRPCICDQFFVASRVDQQYCSTTCRVNAHQSSEQFKAKRRRDDRERYRLKKLGKVRQPKGRKDGTHKAR